MAVSPDGRTLATLNPNGVIQLWDMKTGKERSPSEASPCALQAVGFRPAGTTLVTFGDDCVLREWKAATGRPLGPPRVRLFASYSVIPAFSVGSKVLAIQLLRFEDPPIVRLHDSANGKVLLERQGSIPIVSPDGRRVAIRSKDSGVLIMDVETGKEVQTIPTFREERVPGWPVPMPVGFTPDGQSLIVQGEAVSIWDVRTVEKRASWSLRKKDLLAKHPGRGFQERITSAASSPDGSKVAFALLKFRSGPLVQRDWFGRVLLFETATGNLLHQADADDEILERIAFSPDGKLLAAGGTWMVRVWDVATGKATQQFEGHRGTVKSLAFSPDGKRLASASEDSTVLIWDVSK